MAHAVDPDSWPDATWRLGAHVVDEDGGGVTFAVFAPSATRVQVELYPEALGAEASDSFLLAADSGGIWRARIGGIGVGTLYGFRVWGPNWHWDDAWTPGSPAGFVADLDPEGNRFNPNKVLFDPYAREVTHDVYTDRLAQYGVDDGVFGTGGDDLDGTPRRDVDTARFAPKGIVIDDRTPVAPKPGIPGERAMIYEASIDQLTAHPSSARLAQLLHGEPGFEGVVEVPDELRGTYAGAALMAPYLKGLGFTTVELLPVQETNSSESGRAAKSNAWGYMTLAFFAPNRHYAHDRGPGGPTREFRRMVSAFHEAGLEVYLDVVYNHSAEGGNWNGDVNTTGFTSLGGFATAEYYQLTEEKLLVDGATGTGNQMNYSSVAARELVLDSLRYWSERMGVDGFRFDLAPVLGRLPDAAAPDDWSGQKRFFGDHPLLVSIAALAEREHIEVIAEAWDLWGYEVGNFPRGWGEWNGRFRDAVRRFTKGDANTLDFVDMVNGDYHHFEDAGGVQKSINLVDAHDGFTMADLVSYQHKMNDQPWPFGPSDGGTDDNLSWDSGGSHGLRRQRVRNLWAILFLSRGVPMVVAGDEFGRTQNGNNNPWALDSVAMCNNYAAAATNAPQRVGVEAGVPAAYHDNLGEFGCPPGVNGLLRFARFMAGLRQRHPALRQRQWGDLVPGDGDVSYLFRPPALTGDLADGDRAVSLCIDAPDAQFLVAINMADGPVEFAVPPDDAGRAWRRLIDTASREESHCNVWPEGEGPEAGAAEEVDAWSVAVWLRDSNARGR